MRGFQKFIGIRPNPPQDYIEKGITNGPDLPDYEGVVFSDGTVCLHWLTSVNSHAIFKSYDDFFHIHGHPEYGTEIRWI